MRRGSTLAIVGESGRGKSVTVHSIVKLMAKNAIVKADHVIYRSAKDGKEYRLDQMKPYGADMRRLRGGEIGMVFQDPMSSLNPVYKVGDQVAEGLMQHTGMKKKEAMEQVLEVFRDAIRENAVVVIEGRLSVREDEPSKLMAESISPIEGYDPKHPQANRPDRMRDAAQRLYIRLPSRSCPQYAKVVNLLEIFDGVDNYRRFTFDGQTIVLEDIVEVHPEWRKKLEVLISSGRLAVGPWYVMPDEFLVSGEALIRNLQTGTRVAREFGHEPWPVGYVCDIFGHIAQLPQIFAGFGLKGAVCWRGTPDLGFEHLLYWESPDGTRLATINLGKHHGYADFTLGLRRGRREPYEEASFKADFRKYMEDNLNRWGEVVVLSDALDHAPPTASTPDMLRWIGELYPEAEVIHSDYADLFEREFPGNYPVIRGEQIEPADSEYHVGYQISATLSSRGDVKLANDLAQNELELLLEPQLAARAAAGDVSSLPLLRYQWKKLLANHAHDSICGCSIDAVHRAVLCRCEEVRALGRMLNEEFVLQDEAARTLPGEEPLQPHVFPAAADGVYTLSIYNPLPWEVNSAREI